MNRLLRVVLTAVFCVSVVACNEDDSSAPGNKPGGGSNPPSERPVACEKFAEFHRVFKSLKIHEPALSAQATDSGRLVLASGLFAEQLRDSFSAAAAMRDFSKDAQERYLKYFGWIFTPDGHLRSVPGHPLTKHCLGKE